jgi:hypothetical protein
VALGIEGINRFADARPPRRGIARQLPVDASTAAIPDWWPRELSALGIAIGSSWPDEHGGSALLCHDAIVGVPVIVHSTRCSEDVAQQSAQRVGIHIGMQVVRTNNLGISFNRSPLPAGSGDERAATISPEMRELAGIAGRNEGYALVAGQRMLQHARVHDGGLDTSVGVQGAQDAEAMIERNEVNEQR